MIDLNRDQHDALRQLARAGADGLPLSQVGTGMACRLGVERFVTISQDEPQMVRITRQGLAYSRRDAFA